jgi:hypothetical protein
MLMTGIQCCDQALSTQVKSEHYEWNIYGFGQVLYCARQNYTSLLETDAL